MDGATLSDEASSKGPDESLNGSGEDVSIEINSIAEDHGDNVGGQKELSNAALASEQINIDTTLPFDEGGEKDLVEGENAQEVPDFREGELDGPHALNSDVASELDPIQQQEAVESIGAAENGISAPVDDFAVPEDVHEDIFPDQEEVYDSMGSHQGATDEFYAEHDEATEHEATEHDEGAVDVENEVQDDGTAYDFAQSGSLTHVSEQQLNTSNGDWSLYSTADGYYYYYNHATGESQWADVGAQQEYATAYVEDTRSSHSINSRYDHPTGNRAGPGRGATFYRVPPQVSPHYPMINTHGPGSAEPSGLYNDYLQYREEVYQQPLSPEVIRPSGGGRYSDEDDEDGAGMGGGDIEEGGQGSEDSDEEFIEFLKTPEGKKAFEVRFKN